MAGGKRLMLTRFRTLSRYRWFWCVALAVALCFPQVALAGDCDNWLDIGKSTACKMDVAQYDFYKNVASTIWLGNRILLGGAHWLDALRYQFVQVVFAGVYEQLIATIGPMLPFAATLALAVAALMLIAMPLTGTTGPVDFRMIFIWMVVGPLLLTLTGPYMVEFEKMRTDLGTTLFRSVAGSSFTLSAGAANDMQAPMPLYPNAGCGLDGNGQPLLQRYTTNAEPTIDEQVAALVWATAEDIHCPNSGDGASSILPDRFFVDAPDGPGYFAAGGIQDKSQSDRQRYTATAQEAINRLLLTVLPALVAFLVSLLNFVFACCTMMLWFSLPLGVLFSFFSTNAGWFTELLKRGGEILKTSWMISILLGVFSSILLEAGAAGDALRYSIMAIISGIFVAKFTGSSFGLFSGALEAMSSATGLGAGGGASLGSIGKSFASTATKVGVGAMTGGVGAVGAGLAASSSAAFTAKTAYDASGSGKYALAAAAGRFKPLMQLGEVAAGMGILGGDATDGLYAGRKSTLGLREGRKQMTIDSNKKGDSGEIRSVQAENKGLDRDVRRTEQRPIVGRFVGGIGATAGGVGKAASFIKENATEEQLAARTQQVGSAAKRAGSAMKDTAGVVRENAVAGMRAAIQNPDLVATGAMVAVGGATAGVARVGVGAVRAAGSAMKGRASTLGRSVQSSYQQHAGSRNRAYDVMWKEGKRVRSQMRVAENELPNDAQTEALTYDQIRTKLKSGHRVQRNDDGTATYWQTPTPAAKSRTVTPAARARATQQSAQPRQRKARPAITLDLSNQSSQPKTEQSRSTTSAAPTSYYVDAAQEAKRTVDEVLQESRPNRPRAAQLVAMHKQRMQSSAPPQLPNAKRPRPRLR